MNPDPRYPAIGRRLASQADTVPHPRVAIDTTGTPGGAGNRPWAEVVSGPFGQDTLASILQMAGRPTPIRTTGTPGYVKNQRGTYHHDTGEIGLDVGTPQGVEYGMFVGSPSGPEAVPAVLRHVLGHEVGHALGERPESRADMFAAAIDELSRTASGGPIDKETLAQNVLVRTNQRRTAKRARGYQNPTYAGPVEDNYALRDARAIVDRLLSADIYQNHPAKAPPPREGIISRLMGR